MWAKGRCGGVERSEGELAVSLGSKRDLDAVEERPNLSRLAHCFSNRDETTPVERDPTCGCAVAVPRSHRDLDVWDAVIDLSQYRKQRWIVSARSGNNIYRLVVSGEILPRAPVGMQWKRLKLNSTCPLAPVMPEPANVQEHMGAAVVSTYQAVGLHNPL
jgi:hypothetical protein